MRSDRQIKWELRDSKLPRKRSSDPLQRDIELKDTDSSVQQYGACAIDDFTALQKSIASRVFSNRKAASKK